MGNYLVIGGASGIGLAVAQNLQQQSHQVWATYNKSEQRASGVNYQAYNVLEDQATLQNLPEVLDGLVYCPGAINLKPFARISNADFIADYQLQVGGAIKAIQQVLPLLKKSQHASIVLFSTVAVQKGFTFHSLVSSSKGAIEGLTRALAAEFAPTVRVNAIAPSISHTPLAANLLSTEEKIAANAQRHPLKRVGTAQDSAQAACYLLSQDSSWITGQVLHVDGGMSTLS
jgi:NAD(P)-dependent dehydrogenase (short-subunit alcohol dehydrogenase family)